MLDRWAMNDDISRILSGGKPADAPSAAPADEDRLLVSKRVLGGAPVLFVYRDEGEDAGDSGWTLLSGTESDEAMSDTKQFETRTVEWALENAAGLASILAAPKDSSFERDAEGSAWVELVDE